MLKSQIITSQMQPDTAPYERQFTTEKADIVHVFKFKTDAKCFKTS